MAKTYGLSRKAMADLRGIWTYTEDRWGEEQADIYYREIIRVIELLASGHRRGRPFELRAGYRKHPVGRHVVYFTVEDTRILVMRVLHQSMDVDRHL